MNYHFFLPKEPELNTTFFLAMDAEWKEGDHPRKDNGQFGSGGGGAQTPSNGIQKQAQVSSTLTGIFSQAGFKKQKQPGVNGTVVYYHPASGAKVSVHPAPEGKKWSSKWTHEGPQGAKSGEGSSLAKLLGMAVKKAEEKKNESSQNSSVTAAEIANDPKPALEKMGFKFSHMVGAYQQTQLFHGPNSTFIKLGETGNWVAENGLGEIQSNGHTAETLADYLNKNKNGKTASAEAPPSNTSAHLVLKDKDYTIEKSSSDSVLYAAPNGSKVLYNSITNDWVAQTPGHMTKEGNGAEALKELIANKKIAPGVKNTNKTATLQSAAEKAQAEQAAKELKEKQAKNAIAQAKATATFEAYKSAAPKATSEQAQAIVSYCNNGYVAINNHLRQDTSADGGTKNRIARIDAYLKTATFPEDGVVYRGVKGDFAVHLKSVLMKGTKFADYGFVSTSAFEHSAFGGHLRMKINIKKGQRGAAVAQISHHPGENEILLPRESIFEVVSYNRKTGEVEVNLVQDHFE